MKRVPGKWIALVVVAAFLLIQLIPAGRTNPPVTPSRSLAAHMAVPPEVQSILKRGCYDCHSSETVWPWYSHVAPVSWYVVHDVNVARSHVNFQDWEAQENPKEGLEHLGLTCKLMQEGKMPPADYLLMHKNASVSAADTNTVCSWTQKVAPAADEDQHEHHDHGEHPDKD
jgi:hypothetical protein